MHTLQNLVLPAVVCAAFLAASDISLADDLTASLPTNTTRPWISSDFFSNRLQDWQLTGGRIECIESRPNFPLRTVQVLTRALAEEAESFEIRMTTGPIDAWDAGEGERWVGFLIGAGGSHVDYRITALVHHRPAEDGGLLALIDERGNVQFRDNSRGEGGGLWSINGPIEPTDVPVINATSVAGEGFAAESPESIVLVLRGEPTEDGYSLTLTAHDAADDSVLSAATLINVDQSMIEGSIGLVAHRALQWFNDFTVDGARVQTHSERAFGPIVSAMHTLSDRTLKLTAQMTPLGAADNHEAVLELEEFGTGAWYEAARGTLVEHAFTIPFRVNNWNTRIDVPYRVVYIEKTAGEDVRHEWMGTIRAEPDPEQPFTIAALTCNKCYTGGLKWNGGGIWFPHDDISRNVAMHKPHFLYFSGDQIYEGDLTPAQTNPPEKAMLDYLMKWYRWCWSFRELTRDIPCVTIPDDHDVYHGNIWGAGGRAAIRTEQFTAQDAGGYKMPAWFVNAVHATQTSHLPDPVDATPIEQEISVYFTNIEYGPASFAIVADRMFKSAPAPMLPDAQIVNGWSQNAEWSAAESADIEGAVLLGERQLKFLDQWAENRRQENTFKVLLSQTILANVATIPEDSASGSSIPGIPMLPPGEYLEGQKQAADFDSNGWPQTGRNKVVEAMRKAGAIHLSGDQHLGALIEYGIDDWRDGGYAFSTPSIANTWPRRWFPPTPGANRADDAPAYTGDFTDGFGNKVTVYAVSNPALFGEEPARLNNAAPGYGIVRLTPESQEITFECWPRWVNPRAADAMQYPGWPVTIRVEENR